MTKWEITITKCDNGYVFHARPTQVLLNGLGQQLDVETKVAKEIDEINDFVGDYASHAAAFVSPQVPQAVTNPASQSKQ